NFPAPDFLLGVERPAPLQAGSAFQLDYRTEPNRLVAILASPGLDTATIGGVLAQPLWLPSAGLFPAGLITADGQGVAVARWQMPAGVVGRTMWFAGISGTALPVQASPVAGGIVH
ncbi:MAG: hypothetical protein KDC98_22270, partial [Planctomycetes bacterium]|nr:hypothetical protein [Planctomycetota bacterium]